MGRTLNVVIQELTGTKLILKDNWHVVLPLSHSWFFFREIIRDGERSRCSLCETFANKLLGVRNVRKKLHSYAHKGTQFHPQLITVNWGYMSVRRITLQTKEKGVSELRSVTYPFVGKKKYIFRH